MSEEKTGIGFEQKLEMLESLVTRMEGGGMKLEDLLEEVVGEEGDAPFVGVEAGEQVVVDLGAADLALRYDLTAPLARVAAN